MIAHKNCSCCDRPPSRRVDQLATRIRQITIPAAEVGANAPFVATSISSGVLADEAMQFFAK